MTTENILYPEFEDPDFNKVIALKKEFNEHQYVGFDEKLSNKEQLLSRPSYEI